jgi:hypothetical protein
MVCLFKIETDVSETRNQRILKCISLLTSQE